MSQMPADVRAYNEKLIAEFRINGGAPDGRPLLLLNTTGARTGLRRTTPMMYVRVGDRLLVIPANAGAPRHPDWFYNLAADPRVIVEMEGEEFSATAHVTGGADRAELFAEIARRYPFFAEFQSRVPRQIPVVELIRAPRV